MKLPSTAFKVCALIVIWSLLAALLPVQSAAAQSSPASVKAGKDATVKKKTAGANYGSETTLTLDTSPVTRTYLHFNVSGLNGQTIKSAKLKLYSLKSNSAGLTVRRASNTEWSEGAITYTNAPRMGTAIKSIGKYAANKWLTLDVSKVVKSEGAFTFTLTGRNSAVSSLAAREYKGGAYAPALELTLSSPASSGTGPYGVAGDWDLVFSDEFDGGSVDLNKWEPNWLSGSDTAITKPINGKELSCYDPKQASVADGKLKLSLVKRNCTANNGKTYAYASGIVTSRPHFTFTYGFMEARVWLDGTSSTIYNWPAFWADGTGTWPTTGEIDVFEGLSGKPSWHYHYGSPSTPKETGGYPDIGNRSGWHIFAADWGPGYITFYYDGKQVGKVTSSVVKSSMFVILNYGIASTQTPVMHVPSDFFVDYVRVWKKQ